MTSMQVKKRGCAFSFPNPYSGCHVGTCSAFAGFITCSTTVMMRTGDRLPCCQRAWGSAFSHPLFHSCSVSLRADFTEFLRISVPLYLKEINFSRMDQKSAKWRRRELCHAFEILLLLSGSVCIGIGIQARQALKPLLIHYLQQIMRVDSWTSVKGAGL